MKTPFRTSLLIAMIGLLCGCAAQTPTTSMSRRQAALQHQRGMSEVAMYGDTGTP